MAGRATKRTGKARYHHGDLAPVLIEEALRVIRKQGVGGLTMREVARRARVSHNAPYAHFADMEALLAAVAIRGFELMRQRMVAAMDREFDLEITRLEVLCVEHVCFAVEQPEYYRVMFGSQVPHPLEREGLREAIAAMESVVRDAIERCQNAGVLVPGDPGPIVRTSLSMLHGLASLHLEGRMVLPEGDALVAAVREHTRMIYFGFAPPEIIAAYRQMGPRAYEALGLRRSTRSGEKPR